jgi:hypothetical protein
VSPTPAERVRQAARWLIAAFAGVGAALAAGIQISNLGSIEDTDRLLLAGAGAALGFAGVAVAIWHIAKVLAPQEALLRDLESSPALAARFHDEPTFLGGCYERVTDLTSDYEKGLRAYRRAQIARWKDPGNPVLEAEVKRLNDVFEELSSIVEFLRSVVIYEKTRAAYSKARCWVLLGAILAFIGVVTFAYAANPPEETEPLSPRLIPVVMNND